MAQFEEGAYNPNYGKQSIPSPRSFAAEAIEVINAKCREQGKLLDELCGLLKPVYDQRERPNAPISNETRDSMPLVTELDRSMQDTLDNVQNNTNKLKDILSRVVI